MIDALYIVHRELYLVFTIQHNAMYVQATKFITCMYYAIYIGNCTLYSLYNTMPCMYKLQNLLLVYIMQFT